MTSLLRSFGSKKNVKEFDSLENIIPVNSFDSNESPSMKGGISLFVSEQSNSNQKPLKKVSSFNKMNSVLANSSPFLKKEEKQPEKENVPMRYNILVTSLDKDIKPVKPVDHRFATERSMSSPSPRSTPESKAVYPSQPATPAWEESKLENPIPTPADRKIGRSTSKEYKHAIVEDAADSSEEYEEEEVDRYVVEKDHFPEVDEEEEREYITSVFSKARHNHLEFVVEKITKEKFNSNQRDEYGNTLLHICAQNNHRKLAALILKHAPQTNVNAKNFKSLTPLDYCEKYGFMKMYDWLIEFGAEKDVAMPPSPRQLQQQQQQQQQQQHPPVKQQTRQPNYYR
jgi:hypothetical protein